MKNKIIKAITALLISTILIRCNTIVTNKYEAIKTTQVITDNTISIPSIDLGNVEIYHSTDKKSFNALTPILENRNGKVIIEIIEGTVLDNNGNGTDIVGKYIKYDSDRFTKGNKVQTVYIYNPDSNAFDDVLYRMDSLIE